MPTSLTARVTPKSISAGGTPTATLTLRRLTDADRQGIAGETLTVVSTRGLLTLTECGLG